jgi:putative transcriptional regulator
MAAIKEKYTTSRLRNERLIGESVLQKLRASKPLSWHEIDRICGLLECQPGDFLVYVEKDETSDETEKHAYTLAAEVRAEIREELKCDQGFINHLTKSGIIQRIVRLIRSDDPDAKEHIKETRENIWQEYRDYCKAWGLDFGADLRKSKDYLRRERQQKAMKEAYPGLSPQVLKAIDDMASKDAPPAAGGE